MLRNVEKRQVSLVDWGRHCHHMGTLGEIVDPVPKGEIAPECLSKFGELALSCLLDDGTQRPSMKDVVRVLEYVLQFQENFVSGVAVECGQNYGDIDEMFSSSKSRRHASEYSTDSGVSMTSNRDHSNGSKKNTMVNV